MSVKIYHNPRCTKSRQALAMLEEKKEDIEVIEYLKDLPTKKELKQVLKQLNMSAEELLRKNEKIYKEEYKGKDLSEVEWIEAMIKHPKLIERPIVIKDGKAVIARPTEKLLEVL